MFISTKRGTRLASVAGLAAVAVVALASPAAASADTNQAFGIRTGGVLVAGPFSQSNFPGGPQTNTLVSVSVPTLLSSGTVNTAADSTSASASVENLSVTLGLTATLGATAVSSECSYNSDAVLGGSASIAGASVVILAGQPIVLATSPAANTVIGVPGVATITLNRQVSSPDGSLTVDAIVVNLLNSLQTVRISTSHCHPSVLPVPTVAPQLAAGAGALGLLALGFVLYRRRQSAVDAA